MYNTQHSSIRQAPYIMENFLGDIRRELKMDLLDEVLVVQRPVVTRSCPKCNHSKAEYHSIQTRSADEGETVFYECTKCRYKSKE
ncbi:hypothetical protein PVAP13_9NG133500 [Panicum virgatum]|uniref:DNA-directed RNA polymerase I subunit RPA12 n=1 Tax=Panicum virgatum TaxID=38727 RepID=A0A8T0MFP2_PANVG|nr:hypothetical protein PVAP13_9NG133500 [Panicum virgatum]